MEPVFIKETADGRKVEVIDGKVCLDGKPEAEYLVEVHEHPNRQAIKKAAPRATHMAGRLALTSGEADIAKAALAEAQNAFDLDPGAIAERMRLVYINRTRMIGVE